MNNNYTDVRMDLREVCGWLTEMGHSDLAGIILDMFKDHTWTVNGMTRKDVIKDIIVTAFDEAAFRKLECDVTTYMNTVSYGEAHVD